MPGFGIGRTRRVIATCESEPPRKVLWPDTTAIDKWSSWSGGTGASNGGTAQFPTVCKHSETFSGHAPGTWSFTGKAVKGNAPTCNTVVTAGGTTRLTFVFNVGGTAESCN